MKGKEIGYSHTYQIGASDFEKIWHVIELDDGDDPRQALYKARKVVTDFHFESNKAEEKKLAQQQVSEPVIGTTVEDIYSCSDLEVLKSYKLIVKANPDLQKAYDEQFKKLSNGK